MIRANVLNLKGLYNYVDLSPHTHNIVFPSFIKPNTDKDIIVTKLHGFDTVNDVVANLRYLLSHCGLLVGGENEPALEFGCLHGFHPEREMTPYQYLCLQKKVAEAMKLRYNVKTDRLEPMNKEEEEDGYTWIPLHEFNCYDKETFDFTESFINSIDNEDNKWFVRRIIDLYNDRVKDKTIEKAKKRI